MVYFYLLKTSGNQTWQLKIRQFDDFPFETSVQNGDFSIAMFDYPIILTVIGHIPMIDRLGLECPFLRPAALSNSKKACCGTSASETSGI